MKKFISTYNVGILPDDVLLNGEINPDGNVLRSEKQEVEEGISLISQLVHFLQPFNENHLDKGIESVKLKEMPLKANKLEEKYLKNTD